MSNSINSFSKTDALTNIKELRLQVDEIISTTPVIDMHTHLFAPQFNKLNLWGVDELLTYHYLIAELFRSSDIAPNHFWELPKPGRADLIWEHLFVSQTPLSEATRGVVRVFTALGLNPHTANLEEAREFFREQRPVDYINRVFEIAGVSSVVMTNDPFDEQEVQFWENGIEPDARFHAALRIDPMLIGWQSAAPKLAAQGFETQTTPDDKSIREARRFLDRWIARMRPLYLAVSLPDDFNFPEDTDPVRNLVLQEIILPTCREHNLPFAMMIGVRRGMNPALRAAGDGMGRADMGAVARICAAYPDNRFLVTALSRENQHELCVNARKFSNLMPFGCWWFLNNPSIISEITYERIELLGTSFIPQHSDARILDQLIYKWAHSRRVIGDVLYDNYKSLLCDGWQITGEDIKRDVERLFSGNFNRWTGAN